MAETRRQRSRTVLLVASRGAQILDIAGPAEVFSRCTRILEREHPARPPAYVVHVLSATSQDEIHTSAGIEFRAAGTVSRFVGAADTVLVVGGEAMEEMAFDARLGRWLRRQAMTSRRIGAICTGAFALAGAGLLDGKRATTHWAWAERLAELFPNVKVDADPIFIRDGNVFTSAGISAGMDLALSLVEEDFGAQMALRIARELVLFLRRPGSQSQFSAPLSTQFSDRRPIRELQMWLPGHLKEDLSLDRLAERVSMSVRNFSRVFLLDVGMTPGEYVDRLRVDAVCERLVTSSQGLGRVASQCGFKSADVMRRAMLRVARITPDQYRLRFGRAERRHG